VYSDIWKRGKKPGKRVQRRDVKCKEKGREEAGKKER